MEFPDVQDTFKGKAYICAFLWIKGLANSLSIFQVVMAQTISLVYLGNYFTQKDLVAYGFSNTWLNCIGFSILFGMGSGISTLIGHAYGAKQYSLIRAIFWKGFFVLTITNILFSIIIWFSSDIFKLIGIQESTSDDCTPFLRVLIIKLTAYTYFTLLRFYAQGVGHYFFATIAFTASFIFLLVPMEVFIKVWKIGPISVPYAQGIQATSLVIMMMVYLKVNRLFPHQIRFEKDTEKSNMQQAEEENIDDPLLIRAGGSMLQFTKQLLIHASSFYAEIVFLEIINIIIGTLQSEVQLAANIIAINSLEFCLSFIGGFGLSVNTILATIIGEGNLEKAKKYTKLARITATIQSIVLSMLLLFGRYVWSSIYTSDEDTIQYTVRILLIQSIGVLFDSQSNVGAMSLRAACFANFVFRSFLLSYYVISLTIIVLLAYLFKKGVIGVWMGFLVGQTLIALFMSIKLYKVNWKEVIDNVKKDMEELQIDPEKDDEKERLVNRDNNDKVDENRQALQQSFQENNDG